MAWSNSSDWSSSGKEMSQLSYLGPDMQAVAGALLLVTWVATKA